MADADRSLDAETPTVGLLGDSPSIRSDLADHTVLEGPRAIDGAAPDVIVAVGEAGLADRLGLDTPAPTIPVAVEEGLPSIPGGEVSTAIAASRAGRWPVLERPVLGVSVDGADRDRALFDVTLVSDRPAHISEFAVRRSDATVLETRADGIVIATPAGSHGYAKAAGGVRLATGTDALAVVPISAFATADERWITPVEPLAVSVEREGTPVQVRADDRVLGTVRGGATVEIAPRGTVPTVVPPQSRGDPPA